MPVPRPLGHRLLIEPDLPPEETASGLVLPQDHDHVAVSGTVVAVGAWPVRDQRIRRACLTRCISIAEELAEQFPAAGEYVTALLDEFGRYKAQVERYGGSVEVGDRVAFAAESGLTFTEDGRTYLTLNEDDVVVLVADVAA